MKSAEPVFVDTNVLIECTDEARRHHQEAIRLVETHARLVLSAQVVREYLVVATRPPSSNGLGLSLDAALSNVHEFRERIRLLPEERPILPTLLRLLGNVSCSGKRIHDAHVVATAMAHKIKVIVTLNAGDFSGFTAYVEIVTPQRALG